LAASRAILLAQVFKSCFPPQYKQSPSFSLLSRSSVFNTPSLRTEVISVERFGLKVEVEADGVEDFGGGFFENLFFEKSSFFEVEGVESLVFLVDRILS